MRRPLLSMLLPALLVAFAASAQVPLADPPEGAAAAEPARPLLSINSIDQGSAVSGERPIDVVFRPAPDGVPLAKVDVLINGVPKILFDLQPGDRSVSYQWDTRDVPDGRHVIQAVITDQAGRSRTYETFVYVRNHGGPIPGHSTSTLQIIDKAGAPEGVLTGDSVIRVVPDPTAGAQWVIIYINGKFKAMLNRPPYQFTQPASAELMTGPVVVSASIIRPDETREELGPISAEFDPNYIRAQGGDVVPAAPRASTGLTPARPLNPVAPTNLAGLPAARGGLTPDAPRPVAPDAQVAAPLPASAMAPMAASSAAPTRVALRPQPVVAPDARRAPQGQPAPFVGLPAAPTVTPGSQPSVPVVTAPVTAAPAVAAPTAQPMATPSTRPVALTSPPRILPTAQPRLAPARPAPAGQGIAVRTAPAVAAPAALPVAGPRLATPGRTRPQPAVSRTELGPVKAQMYTVAKGENLAAVALRFDIKAADLSRLNNLTGDSRLKTGQRLLVPRGDLQVNGVSVSTDVAPLRQRAGVPTTPLRFVVQGLGGTVSWIGPEQTVEAALPSGGMLTIQIGSREATVGQERILMDLAAYLDHDRTMVPARFVSEALDVTIELDPDSGSISIRAND